MKLNHRFIFVQKFKNLRIALYIYSSWMSLTHTFPPYAWISKIFAQEQIYLLILFSQRLSELPLYPLHDTVPKELFFHWLLTSTKGKKKVIISTGIEESWKTFPAPFTRSVVLLWICGSITINQILNAVNATLTVMFSLPL